MSKSAERGKGCDMYRHTFVLVSGEEIVTHSDSREIPTMQYGQLYTFVQDEGKRRVTIPVLSILYVDTDEVCEQ